MTDPARQQALTRLRSARGHLDAVMRMVEDDRYCIDVIHQIRAVQGGLDRSRRGMLENHLRTCLPDAYARGEHEQTVTELLDAVLGGGVPRADRSRCHTGMSATAHSDCCRSASRQPAEVSQP
jgi:CsoR family transcriptional regulator, copper-sensing transcriptional repressor